MDVRTDVRHDVSPPLRDLAKTASPPAGEQEEGEEVRVIPLRPGYKPADEPDPVLQPAAGAAGVPAPPVSLGPTLLLNFDGIGQGTPTGFNDCCAPPDTNGAVGLTQYVQWVNLSLAVFKKSDGSLVAGFPVAGNTLWKGFGGACETNNDGDPMVLYDKMADRWVLSQLVVRNPTPPPLFGPFFQCVAVSTTSDATGSYNRYQFSYANFDDYPKMGVWPDAYYITFNMFNSSGTSFLGTDACAYDRTNMLAGNPATQICFQQPPTVGGVLPADMDGHTTPPAGSPNYMVEFDVNSLNLYKFHVDFANPGNSTFGPAINIPVAAFTPFCPQVRGCVPQQGTPTMLDSLGDRLMHRLAYRNFGDHESLVVNHSVAVTVNGNATSGVRWYEIQNPNAATPTVAQQSTFAPDANFRWMGSVAMDQAGDLAVGYSVSSSTMFPAIFIAARAASDPPSTLQPEISVIAGTGSQTSPTRWGDYSAMQVDPVDDCTFWYTTEYYKTSASFSWNTRINSFKFDACDKPDLTIAVSHTGNFTQSDTNKTYTITVKNSGGQPTSGTVTVTDTVPTGLTINASAASGTGWTCTQVAPTVTCTRSDALAPKTSYPDITLTVDVSSTAPGFLTNTATVSGGGEQNTSNDTSDDVTTIIQLGPDPTIAKTHTGSFIQGQTGTYTITVSNVGLADLSGTVTVTDTPPTGLTLPANAASGTGWTCSQDPTTVTCTRSDALANTKSYPPITLTVNVANNAPATVTNTATVSGGGDVNNLNNTANDPTTIIPPPPDLSITKTHTGSFNQGQSSASYTLTVSNASGATATSGLVTVTDTIPTGLTGSFAFGFPWICITSSTTMTCTRTDALPGGGSYSPITLFVNVANDAPASITNTATVSGGGDVSPGNNTASDPTTINPSPDLTIAKSHTPDPFVVGQTGTYTITVSNTGHAATSATVAVSDFLPNGLTATAISGTGWSCSAVPTTFVSCTRPGSGADALAAGSSFPAITVTVSVLGGGPSVTNFVGVNGGGEFNTSNDSASDTANVTAPILTITKSHTGNFTVGQSGTYTITVGNVGPISTISNGNPVSVNDFLPFGLTATAVSGTGWNCSAVPTTFMNCTRSDSLASNLSYPPITMTVAVDSNASATVVNTASVTGGGDTNQHSFSDSTNINVPDLTITKTHTGNFAIGQTGATYTISVKNIGTVATAGGTVTVQDFMPFGLTATAASGTGWTCFVSGGFFVNCTQPAGTLAPGDSYPPITLTVNVTAFNPTTVTNTASVSGIGDANLGNNSSSDTTTIVAPVSITPSGSTAVTVNAGSPAAFTFTANLASSMSVGTVSFNLSGALAQNTRATFSPASVTQTGAVTLTIDTSGNGHVASAAPVGLTPGKVGLIFAAVLLPLLLWTTRTKTGHGRRRAAWLGAGMCISGLLLLAALSGCGGGSTPPPPPPPVVTPPGIYPMTVTATSSVSGVQSSTMNITLTVR